MGQVLDDKTIWQQASSPPPASSEIETESEQPERRISPHIRKRAEQMRQSRERLEHLRPLLAQASASLLRGIIIQSRLVPSMVAQIGGEALPLDAEEDRDRGGLDAPQTFAGDI